MAVRPTPTRLLAAAALAVYAFVAVLLLPLHLLEDAPPAGTAGPVLTLVCGDGNCHDPGHGHGGHAHDATRCLLCGASAAPRTSPPVADLSLPVPGPAAAAPSAAAPRAPSLRRAAASARGPPASAPTH